jgi:hypothetical protein
MKLLICLSILFLTGCSTMKAEPKSGRPSLYWVISEKNGCQDRIGIRGKKLRYTMCF